MDELWRPFQLQDFVFCDGLIPASVVKFSFFYFHKTTEYVVHLFPLTYFILHDLKEAGVGICLLHCLNSSLGNSHLTKLLSK